MVPPLDLEGVAASHLHLQFFVTLATAALLTNEWQRHRLFFWLIFCILSRAQWNGNSLWKIVPPFYWSTCFVLLNHNKTRHPNVLYFFVFFVPAAVHKPAHRLHRKPVVPIITMSTVESTPHRRGITTHLPVILDKTTRQHNTSIRSSNKAHPPRRSAQQIDTSSLSFLLFCSTTRQPQHVPPSFEQAHPSSPPCSTDWHTFIVTLVVCPIFERKITTHFLLPPILLSKARTSPSFLFFRTLIFSPFFF